MAPLPPCPNCKIPLPIEAVNGGELVACHNCAVPVFAELFPAYFRPQAKGSVGEALLTHSHASCFYHPQKQAAVVCGNCGRFLCGLCDLELEGQHLCPTCLETAQRGGKIQSLENRRVLYDVLAFHLALVSIFISFFGLLTGTAAVVLAIRHWKSPRSIVSTGRSRLVLALIIGSLFTLLWISVIAALILAA